MSKGLTEYVACKGNICRAVGLEEQMQTSLQGIAKKAKQNKRHRFRDLYRLLNEDNLLDSWKYLNNKAASGVDRISTKEFEANLLTNIEGLVASLKEKRYRAKLFLGSEILLSMTGKSQFSSSTVFFAPTGQIVWGDTQIPGHFFHGFLRGQTVLHCLFLEFLRKLSLLVLHIIHIT